MSIRIIRRGLTSHSARHLISRRQILLTKQFWKIAVSAFSSLRHLKVHFGVSMAYPKIIRRPAKPPEEYAHLDKSNAIEKWGRMRETTIEHFKFTPRTSAYALIWALAVPLGLFSLVRWHRRRKDIRKGIAPRI